MKTGIFPDGFEGFAKRSKELAKRLDRREAIKPERSLIFESVEDMLKVLSARRVEVLKAARTGSFLFPLWLKN